ncbi:YqcI/YcgG family protein [Pontibacillus salicampi]|uniref:YqcI/YcgG family protein n=1 Tax=Pontibacillus salicampi TaxID=1449801 RepID=A0ABV6LLQ7_9BACI
METKIKHLAETYLPTKMPTWGYDVFDQFASDLLAENNTYSNNLGLEGFKQRQLRLAFIDSTFQKKDLERLAVELTSYVKNFRKYGKNTAFVALFQPARKPFTIETYHKMFWRVLHELYELDDHKWNPSIPKPTYHHLCEFAFQGSAMYVTSNIPLAYEDGFPTNHYFMMVFKPKWLFLQQTHPPLMEQILASSTPNVFRLQEEDIHSFFPVALDEKKLMDGNKTALMKHAKEYLPVEEPYHQLKKGALGSIIQELIVKGASDILIHRSDAFTSKSISKQTTAQVVHVFEGKGTFITDGKEIECKAGERVYIPAHKGGQLRVEQAGCLFAAANVDGIFP